MTVCSEYRSPARAPAAICGRRWLALLSTVVLAIGSACHKPKHTPPGNWILVANNQGSISLLDTDTGLTRGPFLQGQLGGEGPGLFDAVVTRDGKTALLSSFGDRRVYFVDLTDLEAPALLGHVDLEFYAEDISLTRDGKYAVVTDGGYAAQVATLDVAGRAVVQTIRQTDVYANASAIAPDGTVVTANYMASASVDVDPYDRITVKGGAISTWAIDSTGHLAHANDYGLYLRASGEVSTDPAAHWLRPVNVAIAPDGETVLVPDVGSYNETSELDPDGDFSAGIAQYAIAVYRITAPGELTFQSLITGLPRAAQSIAFNAAGDEAYLLGNGGRELDAEGDLVATTSDRLLVLKIAAPGEVSYDETRSADLVRKSGSQLFGVDNLVVRGGSAYASYSTMSVEDAPLSVISRVDLETFEVTRLASGLPADGRVSGLALVNRSKKAEAPTGAATCAGFCGTANRDQACFCDAACADWGDCCADYDPVCTACDPDACTGGQTCVNLDGGTYGCGCPAGLVDDGSGTCVDVDECTAGTDGCADTATCHEPAGGFSARAGPTSCPTAPMAVSAPTGSRTTAPAAARPSTSAPRASPPARRPRPAPRRSRGATPASAPIRSSRTASAAAPAPTATRTTGPAVAWTSTSAPGRPPPATATRPAGTRMAGTTATARLRSSRTAPAAASCRSGARPPPCGHR